MTVREAARALGVSTRLVYKLCQRGELVFHRYGFNRGKIDIESDDLRGYQGRCLNRRQDEPAAARTAPAPVEIPDLDAVLKMARRGYRRA